MKRTTIFNSKFSMLFLALAIVVGASSCGSDDPERIAERDDKKIREWLDEKGYVEFVDYVQVTRYNEETETHEDTGVYFVEIIEGQGDYPTEQATVNINYIGTLLNDKEFDSRFGATLYLPNTILGFRYGLTQFNIGCEGLLLIPSGLGYGPQGTMTVPRNSVLIFDIKMNVFSNGK
jgi:FKBP-type peptidyl-prolyl cis-trans isomerase FkpA